MRRDLIRGLAWTLIGASAPLLVAVLASHYLLKKIDLPSLGVVAFIWTAVIFMATFEFGVGRSLTALLSQPRATEDSNWAARLFWSALIVQLGLSSLVGTGIYIASESLANRFASGSHELVEQTKQSLVVLSASTPFVMSLPSLRAALDAQRRFRLVAASNVLFGCLTYLAPLSLASLTTRLFDLVISIVAARLVFWLVMFALCLYARPELRRPRVSLESLMCLIKFGQWLALATGILGPLIAYLDRFIASLYLPPAEIALYLVAFVVLSRLYVLSSSMHYVLVPNLARETSGNAISTCVSAINVMLLVSVPIVLSLSLLAEPLLLILAKGHVGAHLIFQVLLLGLVFNLLASIPSALLQSSGRAKLIARSYAIQLPFYFLALLLGANHSLASLAYVWSGRVAVDAGLMFQLVLSEFPVSSGTIFRWPHLVLVTGVAITLLVTAWSPTASVVPLAAHVITLGIWMTIVWRRVVGRPRHNMSLRKAD